MKLFKFFLLSEFVFIPLVVALIRYRKIDPSFRPFILLLALGFINQLLGYILILLYHTNVVTFNVFQLVECLLILYQFKRWGFLKTRPALLNLLFVASLIFWLVQNIVLGKLQELSPYFRIYYAFMLVLIIVNEIIYVANETVSIASN